MPGKRLDAISKEELDTLFNQVLEYYDNDDDKYMALALLVSDRSKDPNHQVGAVITSVSGKLLVYGYNGATCGMHDDDFPWNSEGEKTGDVMHNKDYFVVHAEANALLNYLKNGNWNSADLKDGIMYVTWYPCNNCAKLIAQTGIKKIIYHRMYSKPDEIKVNEFIFKKAGIECIPYSSHNITKEAQIFQRNCIEEKVKKLRK